MERKRIALVSCSSKKLKYTTMAKNLYVSPLFKCAKQYAEKNFDEWFILSAKHGLLLPNSIIDPYDFSLNDANAEKRKSWSKSVADDIILNAPYQSTISIFAGSKYRQYLVPRLNGFSVVVPLAGLGIGQQLKWFKENLDE